MLNANETGALLCARGCGLYGTPKNSNLCSLCYKQSVLEHVPFLRLEPETTERLQVHPNPVTAEEPVRKRRCGICQKKVGMLGFNCRCGCIFCGSHRYPEEHSCPFDYKKSGRLALATQLPLKEWWILDSLVKILMLFISLYD